MTTEMAHSPRLHSRAMSATLRPSLYDDTMYWRSVYLMCLYAREQSHGLWVDERLMMEVLQDVKREEFLAKFYWNELESCSPS